MKFGIIQCRKCHRALGFALSYKTTTCPFCNTKLKVNLKDVKHQCDTEKELAALTSKINKHLLELSNDSQVSKKFQIQDFGDILINEPTMNKSSKNISERSVVYENLDPFKRIAIKFKNETESIQLMKTLVVELGRELGEFSSEDFKELLSACGYDVGRCEEYLEKLKELDIVYEPKQEHYRVIE